MNKGQEFAHGKILESGFTYRITEFIIQTSRLNPIAYDSGRISNI